MLNFENAKILSLSIENKFAGAAFKYGSTKSLLVRGSLYDLTNSQGVSGIWSGISGIISNSNDYDDIQLQGVSFGRGRIDRFVFSEGVDVRQKDYEVSLTVFDSGNLFNLTGSYYSGVNFSNAKYLDRFSENFDFNVEQDGTYAYQHSVSCKFVSGIGVQPLDMAKSFASGLLLSSPPFGFFTADYSGFYNESGKRFFKENYNLITNECSFVETFRLPSNVSGDYSIKFTYEINTDERGVSSVVENGSIAGLIDPRDVSAEEGFQAAMTGVFARCSGEFLFYKPSGAYSLNPTRIRLQKRVNRSEGTIDYSVVYNNDPTLANGSTYAWEYTQEIRREECVNFFSEQGRVKGLSTNCTFSERYSNAAAGYTSIKAGLSGRMQSFASSAGSPSIRQTQFGEERSQFKGEISYSTTFTDQLASTATTQIRKVETEVQDNMPVHLVNTFVAYGFGGRQGKEIVQPAGIATPGEKTVSVKVVGYRGVSRSVLLTEAKNRLNASAPTGTDPFILDCGYTFDVNQNTVNARTAWNYFSDWLFTTIKA